MNRRELLLGGTAVGVVTAVGLEQGYSKLLLDGTGDYSSVIDDRYLFGGDFEVEFWLKRPSDESKVVDGFALRLRKPQELSIDLWDAVRATVEEYENKVPVDSNWHHLLAYDGRFFMDGVEHDT